MKDGCETRICVVDVCGTLVRDDTTLGLLRHHFAQYPSGRGLLFRVMTARRSPVRLTFAAIEKVTGRHLLKHAVVRLLAGTPAPKLEKSAHSYASWLLQERRLPAVWQLLSNGLGIDSVVLASASLEPVVRQLALRMGVRYVASTLEERRGVLTGKYAKDLTGCKTQAIAEKYQGLLRSAPMYAISDNLSDRELLESASEAYVVLHRPSHRQRWSDIRAHFIETQ